MPFMALMRVSLAAEIMSPHSQSLGCQALLGADGRWVVLPFDQPFGQGVIQPDQLRDQQREQRCRDERLPE